MSKVTLISHTPEPERTVAAAAKICYSASTIDDLMDNLSVDKTNAFLSMLMDVGHESPIEHASFTFGIEGVSRSLLAQITRHRMASFSVQSQRYVKENNFDYITPPEIAGDPEALSVYLDAMDKAGEAYRALAALLKDKHTDRLVDEGMEREEAARKASKMAIEDARFVLPNACDTKMLVTMNARSLHNFFRHRCCQRAQWEIRAVADEMLVLVRGVAPMLFMHAGPPCVSGPCPEGKMSCGRAAEMRARYKGGSL